jgi:hypothetical protein
MAETETELMLKGYGLTTAELFYRMPDYRNVLNTFIWQDYDLAPDHPGSSGSSSSGRRDRGPAPFRALHPSQDDLARRMAQRDRRVHAALSAPALRG